MTMIPAVHPKPNGQSTIGPARRPDQAVTPSDQQLTVRAVQPASSVPHRYHLWTLILLGVGTLFYEIDVWAFDPEAYPALFGVALVVYLGVVVSMFALDGHHVLTLHGHVDWQMLSWPARLGVVLGYTVLTVLLFSLPVLYLAFAVKDTVDPRPPRPDALKLKTAQLEAELGILPGVDGECQQCHQLLQAGAEYCMYCGKWVSQKARVCLRCAA